MISVNRADGVVIPGFESKFRFVSPETDKIIKSVHQGEQHPQDPTHARFPSSSPASGLPVAVHIEAKIDGPPHMHCSMNQPPTHDGH
jgi:hypothetical protein